VSTPVRMAPVLVLLLAGVQTVGRAADGGAADGGEPLAVFVTLPTSGVFADATFALVEAQTAVRQSLSTSQDLRLVEDAPHADVVVTVLGRGKGDVELTVALRSLDSSIIAPPVPIGERERFIEVMLTTGTCVMTGQWVVPGEAEPCYRRVFVGVGYSDLDSTERVKRPRLNSWEACANAVARDLRAWLSTNRDRVRQFRRSGTAAAR